MSISNSLPDLREAYPPYSPGRAPTETTTLFGLLPGIALLGIVGFAGKWVEHAINTYTKANHITFPNIEYVLWAILFGVVIANTVGLPKIFRPGVATYEFWLKAGIILLGARFILGDILRLGGISLALVGVALVLSIAFMTYLGKAFKLSPKLTTLLAVGSSVCGVSAIIAMAGAIDADEEDSSTAIAAILALGAISLFTFPLIGHALHMTDHAYGLWTGLAVDNTAEATAAGALFSDAAGKYAVLAKTCRNALIGFVVLGYALYWTRRNLQAQAVAVASGDQDRIDRAAGTGTIVIGNKAAYLWRKFPKFVLGFVLISALATAGFFTKGQLNSLGNLSRWAFLLTFAGVGLRTNLRDLGKQGVRPLLVGAFGEIAIAAITLTLVLGADKLHYL